MTTEAGQALTQEAALLRATCQEPGDDDPRLRYADLLDERAVNVPCRGCEERNKLRLLALSHGTDMHFPKPCEVCKGAGSLPSPDAMRAEFIRVQCQLANDDADDAAKGRLGTNPLRRRERKTFPHVVAGLEIPDEWLVDVYPLHSASFLLIFWLGAPLSAVLRRGFVDEIRLPLREFVGGDCRRCEGAGQLRSYHPVEIEHVYDCPDCSGTGRVEGLAGRLFAAHPVTRVVLTDPGMVWQSGSDWVAGMGGGGNHLLPQSIWEQFTKRGPHATESAAQAALSDACVAYGRSEVDWLRTYDERKVAACRRGTTGG